MDITTFLLLEGMVEEDSQLDIGMIAKVEEAVATNSDWEEFADEHAYFLVDL